MFLYPKIKLCIYVLESSQLPTKTFYNTFEAFSYIETEIYSLHT